VKSQRVNRGAALLGDRVFLVTSDAHLVALHRTSGNVIWDREFASANDGYSSTMAPLAVKDKILVGVAGGGSGQRGFVAAISAETGKEAWRFWTVPAKGEPGSETWASFPLTMAALPPGPPAPTIRNRMWSTGLPGIRGPTSMEAAVW